LHHHIHDNRYSAFDEILDQYGLYKVEVIGDAYYVVSGCPMVRSPDDNAERCVDASMAMLRTIPRVCDDSSVQIRVGIHAGPVIAGVVGVKDPRYHLFGPTVTTAMKMESHGIPSKVHVSTAVVERLALGNQQYSMESRGSEAAVPGQEETFIILGKDRTLRKENKKVVEAGSDGGGEKSEGGGLRQRVVAVSGSHSTS